jgi:protein CpxP
MTIFTRPRAMPLARVFAIPALLGATLLGTTFLTSPVLAQTAATPAPAVSDATSAKAETLEQRISTLHDKLMITPGEEAAWASVAQVMRDNSAAIEKLVTAKKAKTPENMTALDDLVTYQAFAQAHVDGLQKLTSTFKTLYDAMPDAQKKVADETFRDFGRGNAAKHG